MARAVANPLALSHRGGAASRRLPPTGRDVRLSRFLAAAPTSGLALLPSRREARICWWHRNRIAIHRLLCSGLVRAPPPAGDGRPCRIRARIAGCWSAVVAPSRLHRRRRSGVPALRTPRRVPGPRGDGLRGGRR